MQKKLHFNSFIAASIAIFIPIFIWGNTVSHFPWIIEKLNFTNSTIGFLGLLIGPAIVGYTSEIFSITTNTQAISVIWIILFLMFIYTIRSSRL